MRRNISQILDYKRQISKHGKIMKIVKRLKFKLNVIFPVFIFLYYKQIMITAYFKIILLFLFFTLFHV